MDRKATCLLVLVAGALIGGLPTDARADDQAETAKALLRRVTSLVDAALDDDPAARRLDGEELVNWALRRKPQLVPLLTDYRIVAKRSPLGREAVVMLCLRATNTAWFEDATCTTSVDREHITVGRSQACVITLKLENICDVR